MLKFVLIIITVLASSFLASQVNAQVISVSEIAYGSEYIFNTASTSQIMTVNLSESKFVTIYLDGGSSNNQGTAIIGDVSDNIITYGSEYVFNSGNTDYLSVTALSETKFVVAYKDISNNNYGTVVIGDVVDNVITYGSEYVLNSGNTDYLSVTALSENKFVVAYQDNRSGVKQGKAIVADINGSTINFGSAYTFNSSITNFTSLKSISSDKIAITYQDGGNSNYGTAIIGTISEQVINFGSEYIFNSSVTSYLSPVILSETKFVVAYQDGGGNLNYGRAIIGNVSDNIITYSSEYVFSPGATSYVSADKLSENEFVVSFQGNSGLNYGKAIIGVVSDDLINFDLKYTFNPSSTSNNFVTRLTDSEFVVAYRDGGGSLNYGTAVIGSIPAKEVVEPEPEPEPIPVPDPVPDPEPEPEPEINLNDGDLISNPNAEDLTKFDIYIVKIVDNKKFKRLILSPHVFDSYGHLNWEDVKDVDQLTIDAYTTSNLVIEIGTDKVYELLPAGDTGVKNLMNSEYDSDSIYIVNNTDINSYE